MQIKVFGNGPKAKQLLEKIKNILEELGLSDFIKSEITSEAKIKKELHIKKNPALIIEEESIDFRDMIFEGIIPEDKELKSMFMSIIGSSDGGGGCAPGGCGSGCSC